MTNECFISSKNNIFCRMFDQLFIFYASACNKEVNIQGESTRKREQQDLLQHITFTFIWMLWIMLILQSSKSRIVYLPIFLSKLDNYGYNVVKSKMATILNFHLVDLDHSSPKYLITRTQNVLYSNVSGIPIFGFTSPM